MDTVGVKYDTNDGDGATDKQDPDCVGLPGFNPNAPVEPKTDRPGPLLPGTLFLPPTDGTPPPGGTTTPPPPPPIITTNTNDNQVTVRNDGGFTVQNYAGAVTSSPVCPPQEATILLGPSTMVNGAARIVAAFDPCVLTGGSVLLHLPDEQGIQLVAANIQGGQTTQSVIVPMQRTASATPGQSSYTVDLSGQVTGPEPLTGIQTTLNGNINALLLWNNGEQGVEFSPDNSVVLNAILRR